VIETMPNHLVEMLVENLDLDYDDVYFTPSPLGMSDLFALANIDVLTLKFPTYIAPRSPSFRSRSSARLDQNVAA
jgi:polyphosphate kinase